MPERNRMIMRLEQLIYLIEVEKHKCISKAARSLFISQPSLSAAIADLERELSTTIFLRSPNGVSLTEAGQNILAKAREIVDAVEELKAIGCGDNDKNRCILTISSLPAFSNYVIYEVNTAFRESHPDTNIIIKDEDQRDVYTHLASGETDIGIIGLFDYEKATYDDFVRQNHLAYQFLLEDQLCVFAGKSHPLAERKNVCIEDISQYPQLLYKNNFSENDFSVYPEIKPLNILRFNELETIKKMIAKGNVLAILPKLTALNDIYTLSGNIVPLKIGNLQMRLTIVIVWSRRQPPSPTKKSFIKTCSGVCGELFSS